MTRRQYTEARKAEAVGLALTIGARQAAIRLGLPHRNVARWAASPEYRAMVVESESDVAARLWQAIADGTTEVADGLRDPKARLGEKAQALRVLVETHRLLTGRATSHSLHVDVTPYAGLSPQEVQDQWDQDRQALAFVRTLEAMDDDALRAWMASDAGIAQLQAMNPTKQQETS